MKFENTEVFNFEGAIRGMRNPLESWGKSDSEFDYLNCEQCKQAYEYKNTECKKSCIGKNDLELMQKLIKAGSEHRKFMRQFFVSVDITAPIYWWKEFDTYRIGVTENSTSTMHKLASTPITIDCFEMDDSLCEVKVDLPFYGVDFYSMWETLISFCEQLRQKYNETKDKRYWKELIRLLPESWLQKRTITMNYENILNMVHQRKNHKLSEWNNAFMNWVSSLPYADELLLLKKEK